MDVSESEILKIIQRELSDFTISESLERIEGGNLNHVWRLQGEEKNLIVKHAPPYIAANPDVSLSPDRITFEARALSLFKTGESLSSIKNERLRPPILHYFNHERNLLIEEDFGQLPDISETLAKELVDPVIGNQIGKFIGKLHRKSYQQDRYRESFSNADIQQTRMEVQYRSAADYAAKVTFDSIEEIKNKTTKLGQELLHPGRCLIMGDLWPPSLLIKENNIRLIDWEFAHFGRPLQDIAHFAAHCWMQAHASQDEDISKKFEKLWKNFWNSYKNELGATFSDIYDQQEDADAANHAGAEILIRAAGPFKEGYVYQSYDYSDPIVHQAVKKARELILSDTLSLIFA